MKTKALLAIGIGLLFGLRLLAQGQSYYVGSNITGQLVLVRTVNLMQQAGGTLTQQAHAYRMFDAREELFRASQAAAMVEGAGKAVPRLHPPVSERAGARSGSAMAAPRAAVLAAAGAGAQSLSVKMASNTFGFDGITHAQQRLANNGNQFSVEPPSQGLAVGNGYIMEGVNNAVAVYSTAGAPLLPNVVSTNQLFGVAAAIDRSTGANGVFPTDIRVFFDQTINRWFVLQRAQDNDVYGNLLPASHLYLAVSQNNDPTGAYNIYVMDTTDANNYYGCPCFPDYLQIGADQYAFYITAGEYNAYYPYVVDTIVLAISKASLAAGTAVSAPSTYQFTIPMVSGFEFAIQPATTPPGASYFLASGGVEFFVSSQGRFASDSRLAVWAMINTSSLNTANPNLQLIQITIPSQAYLYPDVATQKPGPLPYGSTLSPPGLVAYLDGGDSRVLSLCYSGGRLYLTFATQLNDDAGYSRIGGAYVILSPTYRGGVLAASVLRQGYLYVNGNHLLRPAVAVNSQGRGAIVFTLVGGDYYPSAAFLSIDASSTSSTIQIGGLGYAPEDGFSGYDFPGLPNVARWGDYSAAVAASDGSIWMGTEYIPNAARTQLANWGTYLMRFAP